MISNKLAVDMRSEKQYSKRKKIENNLQGRV